MEFHIFDIMQMAVASFKLCKEMTTDKNWDTRFCSDRDNTYIQCTVLCGVCCTAVPDFGEDDVGVEGGNNVRKRLQVRVLFNAELHIFRDLWPGRWLLTAWLYKVIQSLHLIQSFVLQREQNIHVNTLSAKCTIVQCWVFKHTKSWSLSNQRSHGMQFGTTVYYITWQITE